MPETSSDEQDLFKWKEKYFDSLDEMEKLERELQSQVSVISKGFIQISRIAKGHDHKLDKKLAEIRDALQNKRFDNSLNKTLLALEAIVTDAKTNQFEIRDKIANSIQLAINQLLELEIPSSIKKKLRNYSKTLNQKTENLDNHPKLIDEFCGFHHEIIRQYTHASETSSGLLGKLFKSNKTQQQQPSANPHIEKRKHHNEFIEINSEHLDLDSQHDVQHPHPASPSNKPPESEKITTILHSLINNTPITSTFYDKAIKLQQKLNQEINVNKLVDCLDEISTLLFASLNIEQKEIQLYLNTINERLNEIKTFLQQSKSHHETSSQSSLKLSQSIQSKVEKIHADLSSASNLKLLKKSINNNLEGIVNTINHFQQQESERSVSITQQLHGLINRVQQMETESQQIWSKLEEQKQRALEDPLTKLPNRHAYNEYMKSEYARWKRYHTPLSLAIGDIDLFKQINDQYGHLAGDKVLQVAAKIMYKALRETDFIARFGGEEFVVILPNTDTQDAKQAIEKIRLALNDCPFHYQKTRVSITLSFGISTFRDNDTPETVLQRADAALYQAKGNGRNQSKLAI